MDLTVDRATLADALKFLAPLTGRRLLPALEGVLVTAGDDHLTLSATDLEVAATVTVAADVSAGAGGQALVDGKLLTRYVSNDSSEQLTFTRGEDGKLHVSGSGPVAGTLETMPVGDFPALPDPAKRYGPVDVALVATVAQAASSDAARPVLCAVTFDGGEIAATDSFRLARARYATGKHPLDGALLAATTLTRHVAKLSDVEGGVTEPSRPGASFRGRLVAGTKATPRVCQVTMTLSGVEGSFPDFRQLWPEPEGVEVAIPDGGAWIAALKQMRSVITTDNVPVRIEANGRVRLTMSNTATGELVADVDGVVSGGGEARVALGPDLLVSNLAIVGGAAVTMNIRDALKPVVLTSGGPVSVLQMPMRVA